MAGRSKAKPRLLIGCSGGLFCPLGISRVGPVRKSIIIGDHSKSRFWPSLFSHDGWWSIKTQKTTWPLYFSHLDRTSLVNNACIYILPVPFTLTHAIFLRHANLQNHFFPNKSPRLAARCSSAHSKLKPLWSTLARRSHSGQCDHIRNGRQQSNCFILLRHRVGIYLEFQIAYSLVERNFLPI